MKIKSYQKKHGVFNIACNIYLIFPKKNSLQGHFSLKDLNVDATACFDRNISHTDLGEFVKMMEASVEKFIKKNESDRAEHKKLIYIRYQSRNFYFVDKESKSVDIDFSFEVFDTFWNDDILLKVVGMDGKEISVEHNSPRNFKLSSDTQTIRYSPEAEIFLLELVDRISEVQTKLQNFFQEDYRGKDTVKLDQKILRLLNSDQKLLE